MGEVMRVSVSIVIMSNGFHFQHKPFNPNSSVRKIGYRHSRQCLVSMWLPNMLPINLTSACTRKAKSLTLPNMVAGVQSGLVCEEEEEDKVVQREGGYDASFVKQKLPPWGELAIDEDLDIEPEVPIQPESCLKRKASLNVNRVSFLEEMDEETLSKRILVLSRTNKTRSALELFTSMELSVSVAEGCSSAIEMFVAMEEESEVSDSFDTIVYNTMISICGKVNNWRETERLWRHIKENGLTGSRVTYCLLVSIFVRCGQHELALDAYNEMIQNKFEPGNDTMHAIIGACSKDGKWDLALNIFQSMLDSGLKPNAVAFNALINSLGKAGEVELAFRVYNIMKSLGHSPDAYTWNALLGALYRANRHDDALRLYESIKTSQGSQLNSHLYNMALMSCSKLGLWDKALKLLWQLEASGQSVSTASYNLVISACEKARKPEVALQVYEHMVHQKCTPDTFTYLSLIRGCIWGSLWDEVEEILNWAAPDMSLYNAAIQGMCLRGKIELAKKIYTKMRENGLQPDGKTRAMMLQNLQRRKKKQPPRYKTSSKFSYYRCN
ncbi:pentatricopeptide repeat-containing protein At3g29290 isoform X2 [Prunus avium]|uniref:Pentatricopeptide repeat-containing protein At3g29290 isoform X2 n=1 Tax=Prunus avium TaxID=42229 RepID=A0A6P5SIN2_PRUAV|nr:pentatricopeptide repeat-containing protein At3g29290 isoform X2 [Prunus avium]